MVTRLLVTLILLPVCFAYFTCPLWTLRLFKHIPLAWLSCLTLLVSTEIRLIAQRLYHLFLELISPYGVVGCKGIHTGGYKGESVKEEV